MLFLMPREEVLPGSIEMGRTRLILYKTFGNIFSTLSYWMVWGTLGIVMEAGQERHVKKKDLKSLQTDT